jgi:hypothetical protein
MPIVKTEAGQQVMKDRSVPLTPRQRSAFILFDGKKTVDDVLKATAAMGVTSADVEHLLTLGLLAHTPRGATHVETPGSGGGGGTGRSGRHAPGALRRGLPARDQADLRARTARIPAESRGGGRDQL